ncbi:hypothetical protein AB833_07250 [Chromatiales bacterium (ex Bugula neritina AB1)]|nr:hypothetical protein AB833_07250 [Chromatiales bacterium (ex Bugula neritina AB1)]
MPGSTARRIWCLLLVLVGLSPACLLAEGSWQMGLFEGPTHRQVMYETSTGSGHNILKVDILTPGEVINAHVCGHTESHNIRVQIFDPVGGSVYDSTAPGNVSCSSDFNTTWDPAVTNPHQYVTTTAGTFTVHLTNVNSTYLYRYDLTVTNSLNDIIDPRVAGGRLWSLYWYFNAGSYAAVYSTSADLYVVADGGFTGTYFIWRLDLTNFAGFVYSLKANDLGVTSPNAAGDVVAGISVPRTNNSIQEKFPIYLGFPAKSFPAPIGGINISGLSFVDSEGVDSGISPGSTSTIQDSGTFTFETNLSTTGVYEIIIDSGSPNGTGPDGTYGQGDIFLRGNAFPGVNSVEWNGEDNSGTIIPDGAYSAMLSVRTGEFHFTGYDVETSGGPGSEGIKIYRALNSGADLPTTLFWDDFTVLNSSSANAFNQEGLFDGNHNWGTFSSGGIGNNSYIDTYTYGLIAEPNPIGVAITENDIPIPTVDKSFVPSTINTGGSSTMQIEIEYNGSLPLSGVQLTDIMPLGMTLQSDPGSIMVTGAGCSGFTFSGSTVSGGNELSVVGGNIAANSTCIISADVVASLPGGLVNTTSGVSSNELATGVVSNGATLNVVPNTPGPAFSCNGDFYELETTGSSTRLYSIIRDSNVYTRQEFSSASYSASAGYTYTALAYSPVDNYLYAIVNQSDEIGGNPLSGSVLRIDSTGQIFNLGVPERGPNTMAMPVVSDRYVGGTISENGRYIVVTDLSATSNTGGSIPFVERGLILDIDLSGSTPQVLYNRRHGRDVGDIVAHPDSTYYSHNPVEGLISIDSTTGSVTTIGGGVTDSLSGLVADSWGSIYAQSTSGKFLQIDATTGAGTVLSPLASNASADLASCAFGLAVRKTTDVTEVVAGNNVTYTISVANESDSVALFSLSDVLGDNRRFVAGSLVNPFGGSLNAYSGTDTLGITGATLAANSKADLLVEVYYPPDYPHGVSSNLAQLNSPAFGLLNSDDPSSVSFPDSTAIDVLENPSIGISKSASVDGNDITYEFVIENFGNTDITNISLTDNLDTVFGPGNYVLTVAPLFGADPGTLTLHTGFNGTAANAVLLDAASGGTLSIGARAEIRFAVRVTTITDRGAGIGVFSNQVELFGEDPNGAVVSDLSIVDSDPDPDHNGKPVEQAATILTLVQTLQVEGIVFEDNGANGGIVHDGARNGGEALLGGIVVEARDGSSLISSVATASDGTYSLSLPASYGNIPVQVVAADGNGYLAISEYYREDPGNTGPVADGTVTFTPQLNFIGAYKIDFGRIKTPLWQPDSIAEKEPGGAVLHQHQYKATSSGQLTFAIEQESSVPSNTGWQADLYRDSDCSGDLDASEQLWSTPVAVSVDAESLVCVLSKVFIPSDASGGDNFRYDITATLTLDDPAGTTHEVVSELIVTDQTSVIAAGEGVLTLSKTVQNLSSAGAVTSRNSAMPGDVLRYVITFNNIGSGVISNLMISDSTPAYTVLAQPVSCPVSLPQSLATCQVIAPMAGANMAGYSGEVQWLFTGEMAAGATGAVDYNLQVD